MARTQYERITLQTDAPLPRRLAVSCPLVVALASPRVVRPAMPPPLPLAPAFCLRFFFSPALPLLLPPAAAAPPLVDPLAAAPSAEAALAARTLSAAIAATSAACLASAADDAATAAAPSDLAVDCALLPAPLRSPPAPAHSAPRLPRLRAPPTTSMSSSESWFDRLCVARVEYAQMCIEYAQMCITLLRLYLRRLRRRRCSAAVRPLCSSLAHTARISPHVFGLSPSDCPRLPTRISARSARSIHPFCFVPAA
jgi:hypothetical protein